MASYMTMTLKHRQAANRGLPSPCWMAMAVVMPCARVTTVRLLMVGSCLHEAYTVTLWRRESAVCRWWQPQSTSTHAFMSPRSGLPVHKWRRLTAHRDECEEGMPPDSSIAPRSQTPFLKRFVNI